MKTHDPKHTAFALGELTPEERAEIERELRDDPELGAEIAETQEVAGILKRELAAEPAGCLAEHQRWAIIRAATPQRASSANERDAVDPAWWHRAGVWQVIAACAVFGFGVYAISQQLVAPTKPRKVDTAGNTELIVPTEPVALPAVAAGPPEVMTPEEFQVRIAKGGPNLDAARVFPNGVLIVPSKVADDLMNKGEALHFRKHDDGKFAIETSKETQVANVGPSRPTVINQNPNGFTSSGADQGSVLQKRINEFKDARKDVEGIKPKALYGDFKKVLRPVAGVPHLYESIKANGILHVTAEFASADGVIFTETIPDDAVLKVISEPSVSNRVAQ